MPRSPLEPYPHVDRDAFYYMLDQWPVGFKPPWKLEKKKCELLSFASPSITISRNNVPSGAKYWEHLTLDFDLERLLEKNLSGFILKSGGASKLMDVFTFGYFPIVSERAKSVIEAIDPDGCLFAPKLIIDGATGEPHPDPYYHWITRHRFNFKPPKPVPYNQTLDGNTSLLSHMKWDLKTNPAIRTYVAQFPFWSAGANDASIAMSKAAFTQLQLAGLTGLVETTIERGTFWEKGETVGHIV